MVISAEPDDNGVLTQMNNIQFEQPRTSKTTVTNEVDDVAGSQLIFSQICSPDKGNVQSNLRTEAVNDQISASDSKEDTEYIAQSEDSGENSEVVELRRHARKFKKRIRDTESWLGGRAAAPATAPRRAAAPALATAPGRATPSATAPGRGSAFKPPRARAGQTSAQPGPSTGYKRKRAPASSIPSYKYFTASGNV
ncbi:RING-type E3 ubiquitin transferase [Hordeum vulgare]|nr:RING-type E3 ubiquitin transferase [Hordeum vulgare]